MWDKCGTNLRWRDKICCLVLTTTIVRTMLDRTVTLFKEKKRPTIVLTIVSLVQAMSNAKKYDLGVNLDIFDSMLAILGNTVRTSNTALRFF